MSKKTNIIVVLKKIVLHYNCYVLVSSFLHVKPNFVLMENHREPLKLPFCASYYKYGKVVAKYTLKLLTQTQSRCRDEHLYGTEFTANRAALRHCRHLR